MAKTLLERFEKTRVAAPQELHEALRIYATPHPSHLFRSLLSGVINKNVSLIRALEIYLGVILQPRRRT
jgi:hypothetical protein